MLRFHNKSANLLGWCCNRIKILHPFCSRPQVALLHIRFLSSIFAARQRLELSTLISLWGLFCGKKGNVLRVRYDTLKYDHMQLLLGTILFTICLFMFTTILVYHCFFAIMNYFWLSCFFADVGGLGS